MYTLSHKHARTLEHSPKAGQDVAEDPRCDGEMWFTEGFK